MARIRTPFRNLIFFLRIAAGSFAAAGLALYVLILNNVLNDWGTEEVGLTALPVAAVRRPSSSKTRAAYT